MVLVASSDDLPEIGDLEWHGKGFVVALVRDLGLPSQIWLVGGLEE